MHCLASQLLPWLSFHPHPRILAQSISCSNAEEAQDKESLGRTVLQQYTCEDGLEALLLKLSDIMICGL